MTSEKEYKKKIKETYYGESNKINRAYIKALAVVILVIAIILIFSRMQPNALDEQAKLKKFTSEAELKEFLQENAQQGFAEFGGARALEAPTQQIAQETASISSKAAAEDYSATNIQVAGVDEADIVKNDGKYIYTVSGSNVVIVDAYPAENARIVSTINLSDSQPQEIYINGDRLVVFGNVYTYAVRPLPIIEETAKPSIIEPGYNQPLTYIKIYDVSDRSNPILKKDIELNGTYYNSRMIGDYVYGIITTPAYYFGEAYEVPNFSPRQKEFEVYYFDVPDYSYQFTNILSVNVKDDSKEIENKVFLLGYSNNLFVSQNNIYMVYQKRVEPLYFINRLIDEIILPVVPADVSAQINSIRASNKTESEKYEEIGNVLRAWTERIGPDEAQRLEQQLQSKYYALQIELQKEIDKSIVHKISINNGNIEYKTRGEVPGSPLNQFSMDEYNGYFRIATTTTNFGGFGGAGAAVVTPVSARQVSQVETIAVKISVSREERRLEPPEAGEASLVIEEMSAEPEIIEVQIISSMSVGSYQLTISYDKNIVQLHSDNVTGGTTTGFTERPVTVNIDNTIGQATLNHFQTTSSPSGSLSVARLRFTAVSAGISDLTLSGSVVTDTNGNDLNSTEANILLNNKAIKVGPKFVPAAQPSPTPSPPVRQASSLNHIYVLDENMNIIGKMEDLAPGERIFSARFIGDRAYLVTFVRIDPLFVVDLSDPRNPKVLGELKIPGVSEYLHPYDENHIIGVGRSTTDGQFGFNGIKLSLFDVSDVSNPKEIAKYEIGKQGTDSEALRDHKAFLFSKQKNLLVIPIMLVENEGKQFYWQPTWQGAYVFDLTKENGFVLKGRITHADNASDDYYYYGPYSVTRSLYIGNNLYTISSKMIKANNLADLSEINKIDLPGVQVFPKLFVPKLFD